MGLEIMYVNVPLLLLFFVFLHLEIVNKLTICHVIILLSAILWLIT